MQSEDEDEIDQQQQQQHHHHENHHTLSAETTAHLQQLSNNNRGGGDCPSDVNVSLQGNDEEDDRKPPATMIHASSGTVPGGLLSDPENKPPTSVLAADDDDDNWSRQVETDETTTAAHLLLHEDSFRMESVAEGHLNNHHHHHLNGRLGNGGASPGVDVVVDAPHHHHHHHQVDDVVDDDDDDSTSRRVASHAVVPPVPSHPQLTLKERLVLRERQRRIETERARLKRQFALNNHNDGGSVDTDTFNEQDGGASAFRENGSAAEDGTLGEESTRAHADEESADQGNLGFNMERFLRNSDSFNPQLEPTDEDRPTADQGGVLMERFLNYPVVVPPGDPVDVDPLPSTGDVPSDVQRAVSFGVEGAHSLMEEQDPHPGNTLGSFAPSSCDDATNLSGSVSVQIEDDDEVARDPLTPAASVDVAESASDTQSSATPLIMDEPRVLRLTEADMQEMAAIEEASIGNAPPSEREEEMLSEIGELADFGPTHVDPSGNFSQDTPTTAQESASLISAGNHSAPPTSVHGEAPYHQSLEDLIPARSFAPHILVPPGGTMTMEAHPPSVASALETHPPSIAADDPTRNLDEEVIDQTDTGDDDAMEARLSNCSPVMRVDDPISPPPGLVNLLQTHRALSPHLAPESTDALVSSPLPSEHGDGSFRDLPPEPWSPSGKMQISPIPTPVSPRLIEASVAASAPKPPFFHEQIPRTRSRNSSDEESGILASEKTPLLMNVPPEIITRKDRSKSTHEAMEASRRPTDKAIALSSRSDEGHNRGRIAMGGDGADTDFLHFPSAHFAHIQHCRQGSFRSTVDSVFSEIRSEEECSKIEIHNESEFYLLSSVVAKAFPERMFALTVTLIFEIPVLLMISGGSDSLCQLVGRSKYQLLIGFLPLTSAISGNVGLQASTLTTRAISHNHVTRTSYKPWFLNEIGAACLLGVGMGLLLGSIAFVASNYDIAFGLTILIAQFISILTAGVTGTFAPLLFSFIFQRDSGKWGGPLETAIQDIVGSFAMVVISYHILKLLGPGPIDASDMCGGHSDDTDDDSF